MKLKQLSLFLENKPGALTAPCRLLAQEGINIVTFALADTQQFGILRFVTKEWERAQRILEQNGFVAKVNDLVAIEVPDRPGGLVEVLEIVERAGVNVEYMYAFTIKQGGNGVLAFRFNDPDAAVRALQSSHIRMMSFEELLPQI
jgi:hypothetical protein